ncbi:MAG: class I SAM-dependent methyltransferase [Myxococcales bacterium]|nr:class I SAM-dependent methyltransferase [Myxococcales bacterium]
MTEFEKYARDGAYHWAQIDKRWLNRHYNPPLEARYEALVNRIPPNARTILEVGCGDACLLLVGSRARPGCEFYGVDTDSTGIALGQQRLNEAGVNAVIKQGTAYSLPFDAEHFDVVLFADVVEHLDEPARALTEIHRVLKADGVLLLSTPHRQPDFVWDAPYHVHEYDATELKNLLSLFKQVELSGCYPMAWMRFWRKHWFCRSVMRSLGRFGFHPLKKSSSTAGVDYGQIIAICRK